MKKLSKKITLLAATLLAGGTLATPAILAVGDTDFSVNANVKGSSGIGVEFSDSSFSQDFSLDGEKNLSFTTGGGSVTIKDARGNGAGYTLSVSASPLTLNSETLKEGSENSTTGYSLIASSNSSSVSEVGDTNPSDAPSVTDPSGKSSTILATASNASKATHQGMGTFIIGLPTYSVTIPVNAYAGTYTSTITYSIDSAPNN